LDLTVLLDTAHKDEAVYVALDSTGIKVCNREAWPERIWQRLYSTSPLCGTNLKMLLRGDGVGVRSVDEMLDLLRSEGIQGEVFDAAERAARFHGHICPGLAVGCAASMIVLERFPRSADEELVAVVENDSCSVDAIQVLTGCTFGKGNLFFRDYGKSVYTFYSREAEQGLRLVMEDVYSKLKDDFSLFQKVVSGEATERDVQEMRRGMVLNSAAILRMRPEEVFTVQEVPYDPPPSARVFRSVRCDRCGEMVSEGKVVPTERGGLCIPCAQEVGAL